MPAPRPSVPVRIRVPTPLYQKALQHAQRDGRTLSAWIKRLMELAIRKGKS